MDTIEGIAVEMNYKHHSKTIYGCPECGGIFMAA